MLDKIKSYIEKGLVSEQVHPEDADVRIYNYTQECQYTGAWDEVTTKCRGLIYNVRTGEQLSNPFPKFFNYEEHVEKGRPIPAEDPIITEKLDGSLGIFYVLNDKPYIATRGSFTSDQAIWATKWLRENMVWGPNGIWGDGWTYLFEIIYPENRIVVNYDFSGLVWLGGRNIKTGREIHPGDAIPFSFRYAKVIPSCDFKTLKAMEKPNEEGFVLFYPNEGLRLKIKFDEYKRLHKIITGVSAIGIWEELRNGREVKFENVPDEFFNWVEQVQGDLKHKFDTIENLSLQEIGDIQLDLEAELQSGFYTIKRSVKAERIKKMTYPQIGFSMLDGKDYKPLIWRMIRPKGQAVFKKDDN